MCDIIKFENVWKSYGDENILQNFSLDIRRGEFISIIGTSGSGKTTLLRMINGMVKPDKGSVIVMGEEISRWELNKLRRKIGYAMQGNGLFPHMNVAQNIGYVPMISGMGSDEIDDIVNKMLDLLRLPMEVKYKMPDELSGGQQQRVGIARAYANSPEILLMDEPFGAVDAITRYQLQKELKEIYIQTGCTIVFITHDIGEALKLGTKVLVLDKGEIQQFAAPKEIVRNPENDFVRNLLAMLNGEL